MPTHFVRAAVFGMLLGLLGNCYSVEFLPEHDYPNLRRSNVEEVTIRSSPPAGPYERLGVLVIRDYAGDLANHNFRTRIRREARRRGASAAWIERRRLHRQTVLEGYARPSRQGGTGPRSHSTGQLRGNLGVVRVVLYNPARTEAGKQP